MDALSILEKLTKQKRSKWSAGHWCAALLIMIGVPLLTWYVKKRLKAGSDAHAKLEKLQVDMQVRDHAAAVAKTRQQRKELKRQAAELQAEIDAIKADAAEDMQAYDEEMARIAKIKAWRELDEAAGVEQ